MKSRRQSKQLRVRPSVLRLVSFNSCMGSCLLELSHINRKLSPHPDKLGRISCQLPDAAGMCLEGVDGLCPQFVYSIHVSYEHIRMLVIFGRDILSY